MNKHNKQQSNNNAKGHIRIIAGKHRGRKLPVLLADGLRPTTDRVKETVFNWLMPYIHDSRCLDCFAGSGSLGFEAMSRGAGQVTLLELNKAAAKQLQQNQQLLKTSTLTIQQTNSLVYLQEATAHFDIVFIDPPFHQGLATETAALLNQGWLAEDALIYVETEVNHIPQYPNNWQLLKEKTAGQVNYQLYQYHKK